MPASAGTTLIFSIPFGPLRVSVSPLTVSDRRGLEKRDARILSVGTSTALLDGRESTNIGLGEGVIALSVAASRYVNFCIAGSKRSPSDNGSPLPSAP